MSATIQFVRLKEEDKEKLKDLLNTNLDVNDKDTLDEYETSINNLFKHGIIDRQDEKFYLIHELLFRGKYFLDSASIGGWEDCIINLNSLKVDKGLDLLPDRDSVEYENFIRIEFGRIEYG